MPYKKPWNERAFNSNGKENGVAIAHDLKLNRQSAEQVFNSPAPQSDDDSLYQSQDYSAQGENMINVVRNNVPTGSVSPKGVQFLSPKHVTSPDGFVARVYKVSTPDNGGKPDNYGNPYVVYFENGAEKFSKGMKPTSEHLFQLVDMLGTDERDWLGKAVTINKVVDDEGAPRLVFLPAEPAKKTKR